MSKDKWISVKDNLPPMEGMYIVYCKREYEPEMEVMAANFAINQKIWWSDTMIADEEFNVTHWQPFPNPPKNI